MNILLIDGNHYYRKAMQNAKIKEVDYSYRNASIGFRFEALFAG